MKILDTLSQAFESKEEMILFLNKEDYNAVKNELSEFNKTSVSSFGIFKNHKSCFNVDLGFISIMINGKTIYVNSVENLFEILRKNNIENI